MNPRLLTSLILLTVVATAIPRLSGAARLVAGDATVIVLLVAALIVMFRIPIARVPRMAHRDRRKKQRRKRQWWEP